MPCVAHLMLVMLRLLTPFVAHLMLVMVLNMPEQCSFQYLLFHLLFMPKSAEKSASRMDISLRLRQQADHTSNQNPTASLREPPSRQSGGVGHSSLVRGGWRLSLHHRISEPGWGRGDAYHVAESLDQHISPVPMKSGTEAAFSCGFISVYFQANGRL